MSRVGLWLSRLARALVRGVVEGSCGRFRVGFRVVFWVCACWVFDGSRAL